MHRTSTRRALAVASSLAPPAQKAVTPFVDVSSSQTRRPMWEITNMVMARSMAVNYMMASPFLSSVSMGILKQALHPRFSIFDTEKNPILRLGLKAMAYDQFCAGSTKSAVAQKIDALRGVGYQGVALCYGREASEAGEASPKSALEQEAMNLEAAHQWKEGLLNTLDCLSEGDHLAIK